MHKNITRIRSRLSAPATRDAIEKEIADDLDAIEKCCAQLTHALINLTNQVSMGAPAYYRKELEPEIEAARAAIAKATES